MTVEELIERLQEAAELVGVDTPVCLATQPGYPLAFEVYGVTTSVDIASATRCDAHGMYDCDDCAAEVEGVIWIAEGASTHDSPYAPKAAWS